MLFSDWWLKSPIWFRWIQPLLFPLVSEELDIFRKTSCNLQTWGLVITGAMILRDGSDGLMAWCFFFLLPNSVSLDPLGYLWDRYRPNVIVVIHPEASHFCAPSFMDDPSKQTWIMSIGVWHTRYYSTTNYYIIKFTFYSYIMISVVILWYNIPNTHTFLYIFFIASAFPGYQIPSFYSQSPENSVIDRPG